ncbi:MAG: cbb3-type cytochrome c oxidase subunit I [Planctomycetes bacterium]|nr:cbb3-type cytochrome c oxidase subunit I [Planctomycetota bacterium]
MATPTAPPPIARGSPAQADDFPGDGHGDPHAGSAHGHAPGFVRRYVFSTDHKVIAVQFLIAGLLFLMLGGLLAMAIRWQLAWPGSLVPLLGKIADDRYLTLITMHGTVMIFFAITPIVIGAFGNFVIPLAIGARDMAFPVLNMLSFWLLIPAGALLLAAMGAQGELVAGWTAYPPLSDVVGSPEAGQTCWALALIVGGVSSMMGAINYVTTVIKLRAPGMTMGRLPLTVWGVFYTSILNIYFVPVVAAALLMLVADRVGGAHFYTPYGAGDPLLYQHLFWIFGHPEVYILILPVWGVVSDLLAVFARKPAFGARYTVISMGVICALSAVVWGHHMFTSGMNATLAKTFVVLTMLVSIPSAVFFLNWLGTLWRGSLRFEPPMLHALGVVFVFALGGLTGLFNASDALDSFIHDTYFVVGHFHLTMAASVLLGGFAGILYWFPKMFGRMMNRTLSVVHFWLTFIPLNVVFCTQLLQGAQGHMRRIADPVHSYAFLKPFHGLHIMITWAAFVLGAAQILFFVNFFASIFLGRRAPKNPWRANTLEWTVPSPPPHGNFGPRLPTVHRGPFEYSAPGAADDFLPQDAPPAATATG